jgi:hypothetical protein
MRFMPPFSLRFPQRQADKGLQPWPIESVSGRAQISPYFQPCQGP